MSQWINYFTISLLVIGLFALLLLNSKRMMTIALGTVMLVVFVINIQFWQWGFALSKLFTGLMALLILYLSPVETDQSIFSDSKSGTIFRAATLSFGFILMLFVVPKISTFFSMNVEQVLASLFLLYSGLIHLGISKNPYRVILGLLTLLLGFEIIYGTLERSLLINGMLAVVTLFVALVGSYLLNNNRSGEEQ